jgi:hypothetical protein
VPDISTHRKRETLRRRFQPAYVRLLFIGESPPASGRFFYQADSALYRAVLAAFLAYDCSFDGGNFLAKFQRCRVLPAGCCLVDLCSEPVDQLALSERRAACRAAEGALASTIARLRPSGIVTVVRSVEANVERAILSARRQGTLIRLPHPGRWSRHRSQFVGELTQHLGQQLPNPSGPILLPFRSSAYLRPNRA